MNKSNHALILSDNRAKRTVEARPLTQAESRQTTTEHTNPVYEGTPKLRPGSSQGGASDRSSEAGTSYHSPNQNGDEEASNNGAVANTKDEGLNLFDIEGFEDMEKALREIDETKQSKDLKIESLNRYKRDANQLHGWRTGPAPIEDGVNETDTVKIGSLQGTLCLRNVPYEVLLHILLYLMSLSFTRSVNS